MGGALASLDMPNSAARRSPPPRRRSVAPEQVRHVVFGQVLQAGQGQIPSRQAQIRRHPEGGGLGDREQGVRVRPALRRDRRPSGARGRPGRGGGREHGVDVGRALPAQGGAIRLPYGRGQGARRHGHRRGSPTPSPASTWARRPTRWARARSPAPAWTGSRPALARAGGPGHRRGRLPEEIVPVAISSRKGDTTVEIDEAPRRRSSTRGPLEATRGIQQGGYTRRATRPGQRGCRRHGAGERRVGPGANGRTPLATIVAQAAVADDFPYLARANAARKALDKAPRACRWTTSTCSR